VDRKARQPTVSNFHIRPISLTLATWLTSVSFSLPRTGTPLVWTTQGLRNNVSKWRLCKTKCIHRERWPGLWGSANLAWSSLSFEACSLCSPSSKRCFVFLRLVKSFHFTPTYWPLSTKQKATVLWSIVDWATPLLWQHLPDVIIYDLTLTKLNSAHWERIPTLWNHNDMHLTKTMGPVCWVILDRKPTGRIATRITCVRQRTRVVDGTWCWFGSQVRNQAPDFRDWQTLPVELLRHL